MGKRCLLLLISVAVVCWLTIASSVAGETRIEVDENGDEYEVKRFHIQGRQLNGQGSKSQCVVTRRKRASRAMAPVPASVTVKSQQLTLTPAGGIVDGVAIPLPVKSEQSSSKRRYVALATVHVPEDDDDDEETEEDDDQDENANDGQTQFIQFQPAEDVLGGAQGHRAQLSQGVSVVANAATNANVGEEAGIVVVQSQQPPKVNPNTHAVFELKPLAQANFWPQIADLDDDDDVDVAANQDEDDIFFYGNRYKPVGFYEEKDHFISEDSPVSTTAIWSTDPEDDIHPVINEANQRPNQKKKKQQNKRRNPNKKQGQQQQQQQKKKRRRPELLEQEQKIKRKKQQQQLDEIIADNDKQPLESGPVAVAGSASTAPSKNKKKKKKKKNSSSSGSSSSSVNKRRRRPSSSSSSSSSSSLSDRPLGGYRRRRPQTERQREEKRRRRLQQQKRRRLQEQRRRRRRRNRIQQQQYDRRDYYNDEPIINCIYINKDPTTTTTTTQRPFWNILGRDASAVNDSGKDSQLPTRDIETEKALLQAIRRNADFGNRKRTNLKFVA